MTCCQVRAAAAPIHLHAAGRHLPWPAAALPSRAFASNSPNVDEASSLEYNKAVQAYKAALTGAQAIPSRHMLVGVCYPGMRLQGCMDHHPFVCPPPMQA